MCGIVGYIGHRNAYPILIKGLQRLEYRGYDSAGVALLGAEIMNYKIKVRLLILRIIAKTRTRLALLELAIQDGLHMEFQIILMLIRIILTTNQFQLYITV